MQVQEDIIGIFSNKYGCTKEEIISAESFAILGIDSLNVLMKQFHGIKYLILLPVNIIYIIALHRVNLKKVKKIKMG